MALYTPAEANKILRQLQDEQKMILENEAKSSTFIVAHVEEPESVRPKYDFLETQKKLTHVCSNIYKVKHAINKFNVKTIVPVADRTIDQVLVMLPHLTARQKVLREMVSRVPKERKVDRYSSSPLVEYVYTNYDADEAADSYAYVTGLLDQIRTSLDTINNTARKISFELE